MKAPGLRDGSSGLLVAFEYGFHAVQQFLQAEWLRNVIVHFGDVQPQDLIDVLRLCGQYNDWDLGSFLISFELLVHLPAVHFGHHQVQQDQVGLVGANSCQPIGAALGADHFEHLAAEDEADQVDHLRLVFDADHLTQSTCWHDLVFTPAPPMEKGNWPKFTINKTQACSPRESY